MSINQAFQPWARSSGLIGALLLLAWLPSQLAAYRVEQWQGMSLAFHLPLTLGVILILFLRRHDPLYRWLSLMAIASLSVVLIRGAALSAHLDDLAGYSVILQATVGLASFGVAMTLSRRSRPFHGAWLIGVALLLWLIMLSDLLPPIAFVLLSALVAISAFFASSLLLADTFVHHRDWVCAILTVPFALAAWFGLHDLALALGWLESGTPQVPFARLLVLVALLVILTGRLGQSLNQLDAANAILRQRLHEQESELRHLSEKEHEHTRQSTLERERERLMRDLHDGISGHLVSIIAQAERPQLEVGAISRAAREALNDLRLVVQSLDLGEDDLLVALAGLRERLQPQLRRQGVHLEWSTESQPSISGLTPGHTLAVLRILQEAVTNALRHGPATRIAIRVLAANDGGTLIKIENDGQPPLDTHYGHGLYNMHKRAVSLGGQVSLQTTSNGALLELYLPICLRQAEV